jgi:hypothetical protein
MRAKPLSIHSFCSKLTKFATKYKMFFQKTKFILLIFNLFNFYFHIINLKNKIHFK